MSIGYENIVRFPPYTDNWRAMTGDWPDAPWRDRRKVRTPWRGHYSSRAGYWIVALALLMTMATSTIPTPLYVLYQQRDHFSSLMVSIVFAVYAAGVIVSLLLVGHVSDWLGRRRVLATGLFMNVASAFIFMVAPSLTGLIVARVVSGFSVGLTTATATAYLAELHLRAHPEANRRRAQVMAIAVNLGGIGFGPLIAGLLAQFAPAPLVLPYFVVGLVLALLATLVIATPETIDASRAHTRWHAQRIVVPVNARRQFFAACLAGLSAFAVYGVFSSLVPRFLAETMGITSHAVAGIVAFTVFASGALAQMALRSLRSTTLLRTGSPTLLVGLALLVIGIWSANLPLFVIGTVVTGVGTGLIFRGAMSSVSESAPSDSRAEALAGFFLSAYVGLSVPVVALGLASGHVSTRELILIFGAAVALATTLSVRSVVRGDEVTPPVQSSDLPESPVPAPATSANCGAARREVAHTSRRTHRTLTSHVASDAFASGGPAYKENHDDQ
jgi:MFS family permease